MESVRNIVKEAHEQGIILSLENLLETLTSEGLKVEFGKIGIRTTYALIYDDPHDVEVTGFTYVKDMKYYNENVGKYKALQQAVARKRLVEEKEVTNS